MEGATVSSRPRRVQAQSDGAAMVRFTDKNRLRWRFLWTIRHIWAGGQVPLRSIRYRALYDGLPARKRHESLYIILMTARERWLEPARSGLMATRSWTSITMLNLAENDLRNVILEQEPRISDVNIDIEPDPSRDCLIINIQYVLADSNTPDNLVFPFYLNAVREEGSDEAQ